jgi:hypothetical protein
LDWVIAASTASVSELSSRRDKWRYTAVCVVNGLLRRSRAINEFTRRSLRRLNSDSNVAPMIAVLGRGWPEDSAPPTGNGARGTGESDMVQLEICGGVPAACVETPVSAAEMFELGMIYSSGREIPADLVTAQARAREYFEAYGPSSD